MLTCVPQYSTLWRAQRRPAVSLPQMENLNLIMRTHQTNLSLTGALQRPEVKKDKEKPRDCHRLQETKEMWQLNATWDPEKWHQRRNWWNPNKGCSFMNSTVPILMSLFWLSQDGLYKLGMLGEAWWREYRNTVLFYNFIQNYFRINTNFKWIKFGSLHTWKYIS